MAKPSDINFWVIRSLLKTGILRAEPSQEQAKNFLVLKSFIGYVVQSFLAITVGWILTCIYAFEGLTRGSDSRSDPNAPFLLQGLGLEINLLIICSIILSQLVYLVVRVRFNRKLEFKLQLPFWILVGLASLSVWKILDYYSQASNSAEYTLYLETPRDFALIWMVLGTLTMVGYELNRVNTRKRDLELELESCKTKIALLLENGDQLDRVRDVEFTFTFKYDKRTEKAASALEKRGYDLIVLDQSYIKSTFVAIKELSLNEIAAEITPLMDIAIEYKGTYLSFTADLPTTTQ